MVVLALANRVCFAAVMAKTPCIDADRLLTRLERLSGYGACEGSGVTRMALSDADRAARDQCCAWLAEFDAEIRIDAIGNIFGMLPGRSPGAPVMTGSHLDTVVSGGTLDGAYGVLAGLEVLNALHDAGHRTESSIAVAAFTNEEGVRFTPDMMGSLVFAGGFPLADALDRVDQSGLRLGDELERIGYAGRAPMADLRPSHFIELHIEQGPVLENESVRLGVVENLQGISWSRVEILGQANHAGTTPMHLRQDAGYVAARLVSFLRELIDEVGATQLATSGQIQLQPNLINVIAKRATVSVDLRNVDASALAKADGRLDEWLAEIAAAEHVEVVRETLARFDPVEFDAGLVALIEREARSLGQEPRRMTSGAGHDAQMMTRICPAAMIFVPSRAGVSHSPAEHSEPADLVLGAELLLQTILSLSD